MKEIPMLYSTPMVAAILEERKTITRRLRGLEYINKEPGNWNLIEVDSPFKPGDVYWFEGQGHDRIALKCQYGKPGDVYWVRETHYAYGWWIQEGTTKSGEPAWTFKDFTIEDRDGKYHFEDNKPPEALIRTKRKQILGWYRRPSIFMPYAAARIWLQKAATKVERVCDITSEDAIAEGMACLSKDGGRTYKFGIPDLDGCPGNDDHGWHWQEWETDPVEAFKKLWCKINGIETWNHWVWANTFKVLSTTGKPDLKTINN